MAGVRLLIVGSWTRVMITASLLLAFWLVIAWLAATGRLADIRYVNVPLVHPYPRAGYVQNPFNLSNRGDLINVSEAARVKADLLRDGQVELQALEAGDPALLGGADTGRAREKLAALIAKNNASGLIERQQVKLDSILVGRLSDPNDPSIVWMVEERGAGTISRYSKSTGALVSQEAVRFTARFWLVNLSGRYLIADAQVASEPAPAARQ